MNKIIALPYLNIITPSITISGYTARPAAALLEGPPGIAKSALVGALTRKIGAFFKTVLLATHEPADIGGFPVADQVRACVRFLKAEWLVEAIEAAKSGRLAVVFFDEFNWAIPQMQAAVMQMILEGVDGVDPDLLRFVLAQNPPQHAEGAYANIAPLRNRATHYPVTDPGMSNFAEFLSGADTVDENVPSFDLEAWQPHRAKKIALLAAYVRARQDSIIESPEKAEGRKYLGYCTRRSLLSMAGLHATCDLFGWSSLKHDVACGSIGEPQAVEYMKWERVMDLGDPEAFLKAPKTTPYDEKRDDRMFAILGAVCQCAIIPQKTTKVYADRWESAWEVIDHLKAKGLDKAICSTGVRTLIARSSRPKGHSLTPLVMKLTSELQPIIDLSAEV